MTSLDDLIRDTLAERARDVDGLDLAAFADRPAPMHRRSRWVAVGTVVVVAAAILVAVVLVAPWRGAPDRNAAPPAIPTPPVGMQWVSYHGITLTVPDSWDTTTFPCATGAGRSPLVTIAVPGAAIPCPPPVPLTPSDPVSVTLAVLGDQSARGDRITVGGHAAYRADYSQTVDPASPLSADVQLPDAGVQLSVVVPSGDATVVDGILADVEYTPVDHLGCRARLTGQGPGDGAPVDATSGVVCEYTDRVGATPPQLIGARVLTADELAVVQGLVSESELSAAAEPEVTGRGYAIHEYLLLTPSGTTSVRTDDPFVLNPPDATFVQDGKYLLLPGHVAPEDLPAAYP